MCLSNKENISSSGALLSFTTARLRAKAMAALILYLGLSPTYLLPGAYFSLTLFITALLPAVAIALTFLVGLVSTQKRKIIFALTLLFQAALCTVLLLPIHPFLMLILIPCIGSMVFFMPAMIRPIGLEWSGQHLAIGVIAHIIGQFVRGMTAFAPAGSLLTLFFSLYMILCLFTLNRYALMQTSGEKLSLPTKLLAQNRVLITSLSAIALLASGWEALRDAVTFAWNTIIKGIAAFISFLMRLFPAMSPIPNTGESQGMDFGGLSEAQQPSLLSIILEKILIVIGIIIGLAVIVFALYKAYKLIQKAIKNLLHRFRAYTKSIGEGYTDKTENLFDIGQVSKAFLQKLSAVTHRVKRLPPMGKLTPRDKVRRIFALIRNRMADLPDSLTARELLGNDSLQLTQEQAARLAFIYEQARYSSEPITPAQADEMLKNAGL